MKAEADSVPRTGCVRRVQGPAHWCLFLGACPPFAAPHVPAATLQHLDADRPVL